MCLALWGLLRQKCASLQKHTLEDTTRVFESIVRCFYFVLCIDYQGVCVIKGLVTRGWSMLGPRAAAGSSCCSWALLGPHAAAGLCCVLVLQLGCAGSSCCSWALLGPCAAVGLCCVLMLQLGCARRSFPFMSMWA